MTHAPAGQKLHGAEDPGPVGPPTHHDHGAGEDAVQLLGQPPVVALGLLAVQGNEIVVTCQLTTISARYNKLAPGNRGSRTGYISSLRMRVDETL